MDQHAICKLIPHRPPMLLIDRVLETTERTLRAEKQFRADEFFFQGHYPVEPIVPGVILCECAAQAAAILLASRGENRDGVPVLTRLNDVRFKKIVRPHDVLLINVTLEEELSNAFFLSASGEVAGQVAFRLRLACTIAPRHMEPSR